MSTIYIKDLVVVAKHGVHQRERQKAQRFVFNLEADVDTARAGLSDELADTVDYGELKRIIVDTTEQHSFSLLERLAQAIVGQILTDKRIKRLKLSIDKPDAFRNGTPGVKLEVTV